MWKIMPLHWKKGRQKVSDCMKNVIFESLLRWAGCRFQQKFTQETVALYKLDQIVELTLRYTCDKWTQRLKVVNNGLPFATGKYYHVLGTWDCSLCLSGLTQVSLFIVSKVCN